MNSRIQSRIVIPTFRHHCCRFLFVQPNINKSSSAYHTINNRRQNENRRSCFPLSKHLSQRSVRYAPIPLFLNFQRNLSSNGNSLVRDFEKAFNTPEAPHLSPAEEAAKIAVKASNMPDFIRTVSDWKIVEIAQNWLLNMHDLTGLPWWATIAVTAFIARTTVTLPFSLIQVHNTSKLLKIQSEMNDIVKVLKKDATRRVKIEGYPESLTRKEYNYKLKNEWKNLVVRDNCHPAKSYILMWIQLPLWFAFSIATRNLCYMLPHPDVSAQITYLEMMVGGFGWVSNLTDVDHYMILPMILGLLNLCIIEVHMMFRGNIPLTTFDKWRNNFFRFISIALIPLASFVPAATNIYWLTSSFFGLCQAFLLPSTRLQRFFGLPIDKFEREHPYRHFYGNLRSRLRLAEK